MKIKTQKKILKIVYHIVAIILAMIFLSPFYISIVYSLKTKSEIAFTGLAWPKVLHFENFTKAIEMSNFFNAAKNSLIVTIGVVLLVTFTCSMAAYVIARGKGKIYSVMYYISLAAILIPFQVVMLPLYKTIDKARLMNTNLGLILAIAGFQVGYNIFIYTGFIKTVPIEIEEAATIDGCNKFQTFWIIVFPLLKPIVATSIILNALTAWNEFPITLIIAQTDSAKTIPLSQYFFFGQYSSELNLAFASFTLAMIPIIILYLILQKYIIGGLMAGGVKG
ncbi:carbohydrate ABC transporter permease [Clostridium grantii]|uniref:Raffinose/stachyose/melibiose transport system permease protein n=1 Tax=Clostridium grantii DSM 8605 TaxID=1121316 RepID=A0A1M5T493_9CLOT|nr:carbohydrate ABC transporter permease [Clostridium grantii]SHH45571.1 raffinose/stachyose/melibiose transport system permease protein [Clostridium grantii DSM 8605]